MQANASAHTPPPWTLRVAATVYAGISYLLFLAVFLYAIGFVEGLVVPKGIDDGAGRPAAVAVPVNLALLLLFAVQHSLMARPAFKRWWTRFVPRAIERSTYVLFATLALALLMWAWQPLPGTVWSVEAPWARLALYALSLLGWGIVLLSTFLIDHAHLFGLQQVARHRRGQPPAEPGFATPLLYRFVRHPLYLGFVIAFWSAPTMSVGHLLFAGATTAYILVAIQLEERDLLRFLGEPYAAYRKRVPMLLPGRPRD